MATTAQEVVNDIRALVIEPLAAYFTDARLLSLVDLAQKDFVRRSRVLETRAYAATVADQAIYAVPDDFLGSLRVFYNNFQNAADAWVPLQAIAVEKMAQQYQNFLSQTITSKQLPTYYFFLGNQIQLYPTPTVGDVANNLCMMYEQKSAALASLADTLSIDDSLVPGVTAWVLWRVWMQDNEDQKASAWKMEFEMEVGRARSWKKMRQLDSRTSLDVESWTGRTVSGWNNSTTGSTGNPLAL